VSCRGMGQRERGDSPWALLENETKRGNWEELGRVAGNSGMGKRTVISPHANVSYGEVTLPVVGKKGLVKETGGKGGL